MSIVSGFVRNLIAKQVDDHGLVVWYDPDGAYASTLTELNLPDTKVLLYRDSFVQLRWEIDQKHLMDGEEAPRLVIYISLGDVPEILTYGMIYSPR